MKRGLLCLAILLAMTLVMVACGRDNGDDPTDATEEPANVATPEPEEPEVDQNNDEEPELDGLYVPFYLAPMAERITIDIGFGFGTPEGADVPPGTTPSTSSIPEIMDLLNIDLNYLWEVPSAQADDRFQLALATGEIPDIMRLGHRDFAELSQFGMLRDLSDAYEQFIHPEIRAMFEFYDNVPLQMATTGGELLAIPHFRDTFGMVKLLWYRHDWLEALELPVPTTMDEMHEVALAFVENDMSEQGNTTGLGLFQDITHTWFPCARGIFYGYGAFPTSWIERDGELVFGTIMPQTQHGLNRLRQMYADGAIHREFATMNLDQLVAEISGDRVGMVMGEWWLSAWPMNHNKSLNPDADWRATFLVSATDAPAQTTVARNMVNDFLVVSANAPAGTEEALIRIINNHWDINTALAHDRFGDLLEQENGFVWNWSPAYLILANFLNVNHFAISDALRTGDTSALTREQAQWYADTRFYLEGMTFEDSDLFARLELEWAEDRPVAEAWGIYISRVAPYGGWGLTERVRDEGRFIFDEYYGEPTPTEIARASILHDMWEEFALRYIMGEHPYDAWYTFVSDWLTLGGEDWTREVNEQFRGLR
ncbi:MAG: extracellular solute-binding protein [Defluviitaleaceae bacterium]|nr:extracellular solute-binding protein [Defluviitaleaceae bacterium]